MILAKSVFALCYLHEQTYIRARSLRSVHSRMDGTTDKCIDCPRLRLRERDAFRGGSASAIEIHNLSCSNRIKKIYNFIRMCIISVNY